MNGNKNILLYNTCPTTILHKLTWLHIILKLNISTINNIIKETMVNTNDKDSQVKKEDIYVDDTTSEINEAHEMVVNN